MLNLSNFGWKLDSFIHPLKLVPSLVTEYLFRIIYPLQTFLCKVFASKWKIITFDSSLQGYHGKRTITELLRNEEIYGSVMSFIFFLLISYDMAHMIIWTNKRHFHFDVSDKATLMYGGHWALLLNLALSRQQKLTQIDEFIGHGDLCEICMNIIFSFRHQLWASQWVSELSYAEHIVWGESKKDIYVNLNLWF